MTVQRRTFLSTLSAFAGIAALRPRTTLSAQAAQSWDMSWLDGLNGKHKQVFDLSDMEIGLLVVKNWLDAWQDVYGLKHPEVNAVVGIAGRAFPINASDALYAKYPIGELWKVNDPATGKPAQRNPFMEGSPAKVRPLQARGTVFNRKSTRLNSSHGYISYAVFCLK